MSKNKKSSGLAYSLITAPKIYTIKRGDPLNIIGSTKIKTKENDKSKKQQSNQHSIMDCTRTISCHVYNGRYYESYSTNRGISRITSMGNIDTIRIGKVYWY